jgi:hypothetical protein
MHQWSRVRVFVIGGVALAAVLVLVALVFFEPARELVLG